jgi:3-hydroxyisobutyrate dehydrogenase-like beta-hydroxyacid dehydrogenase
MKLGFIRLGVMGRPMALNLIKGGHDMNVYARRAEWAAPLVAAGARLFDSPAEVAAHSDAIFTTKACNQLALLVAAQGAAEALALTRAKARTTCPR